MIDLLRDDESCVADSAENALRPINAKRARRSVAGGEA
jgi:hypothetical protein